MSERPAVEQDPQTPSEPQPARPRRRRRVLRLLAWTVGITAVLGLVAGEVVARVVLGMGDPPLYQADPEIEYLPQPSRTYHRFGNTISINSYSMRSPEFPAHKTDPTELRVMVLGDSIVFGGSPTDQKDLATTQMPGLLKEQLGRSVVVGNISCGSWGPPNVLAYITRHGLFDADVVIIVLNSEDASDSPTFAPLTSEQPTHSPVLALQEALTLYVPKAFRYHVLGEREKPKVEPPPSAEAKRTALAALEKIISTARAKGARVLVVHHAKLSELTAGRMEPGYELIRGAAARAGVRFIETQAVMVRLIENEKKGYRDYIHPDAAGQAVLAKLLADEVTRMVRD